MININHLRSFYICALHKNVTKAAETLQVSQPSVSQQIKSFETDIGFPLFYRNGRFLELTSEGRQLFNKSQNIFNSMNSIEDFIENRTDFSGHIYLNVSADIEKPFIAKVSAALMKSFILKEARLKITSFTQIQPQNQKSSQSIELFLTSEKQKKLNLVSEFSFPVKLISNIQNIDLGHVKTNHLKSLLSRLGQKLAIPGPGHKLRDELNENLKLFDFESNVILESDIISCLSEAVREGLGCSLLPLQYIYDDIRKNKLSVYGPPNGFWEHKLYLYSSDKSPSTVSKELTRIIQKFSLQQGG